jgi:putative holliday junction resolvase
MARIGRRIAFDYGDVRIGVAVCDPDGILATPYGALQSKDPQLMSRIFELIQEFEPVKFYIGLPVQLSGVDSESTRKAREFGESLASKFDIPCEYIDERLSTVSAVKNLAEAGISAKEAKNKIDAMAAVQILEQGLRKVRSEL